MAVLVRSTLLLVLGLSPAAARGGNSPKPWSNPTVVSFNTTFSDYAVLQQAPAKSAVYGLAPAGASLTITVAGSAATDVSYIIKATASARGGWKAYLKPADDKDVTITAHCASGCTNSTDAVLEHVTFGDVWYCSGQSNMWLPMGFSYSRNYTAANISSGKFSNIRLMAGDSQHANAWPWATAKDAVNATHMETSKLFQFSAACWYFAEALTLEFEAAGKTPPTLGLVNTAIGGSMIEEWTLNSTLETCQNTSHIGGGQQSLWDKNVVPYLSMTVKGFLWYQGENNMHGVKGNSADHTGYGCMMPAMIKLWRQHWAVEPGTTEPDAPFGLVVLPSSGGEGGANMGAMRWAQTANYGVMPNAEMNNTFLAQAFDLNDPWGDKTCYGMGCCNQYLGPINPACVALKCDVPTPSGNLSQPCMKARCPPPFNSSNCDHATARAKLPPTACDAYCAVLHSTPVYMGGIHPRLKRPVGERLGKAAFNQVYGGAAAVTGPTISGCTLVGGTLTVAFDPALLKSSKVVVQPMASPAVPTMLQVLTNASLFCAEPLLKEINVTVPAKGEQPAHISKQGVYYCVDALGLSGDELAAARTAHEGAKVSVTGRPPACPYEEAWVTVEAKLGTAPGTITIDTASLNSTAAISGVRYAWTGDCCDPVKVAGKPCPAKQCPLVSSEGLPANPWMAKVVGGKCACMPPQKC